MKKIIVILSLYFTTISSIFSSPIQFHTISEGMVTTIVTNASKTIVALGYKSGKVVIFDLNTNEIISTYTSQRKKISSLVFNSNDKLYSTSDDGSLYSYGIQDKEVKLFSVTTKLSGIQIINKNKAYLVDFQGQFYEFNFANKKTVRLERNSRVTGVMNFQYDVKRNEFIISTIRKKIIFLNNELNILNQRGISNPQNKRIKNIRITSSYNYIHIIYKDNTYSLLNLNNLKEIFSSSEKNLKVLGAELTNNDQTLVISSGEGLSLIRLKDKNTLNKSLKTNVHYISNINDSSLLLITNRGALKNYQVKKDIVKSSSKNEELSFYNFKDKNEQQIRLALKNYNPRIYFTNGQHLLHILLENPILSVDKFKLIFDILIQKNIDFKKYDFSGINVWSYDFEKAQRNHPYAEVFNQFKNEKDQLADTMFYSASLGRFDLAYDYINLSGSRNLDRTNYLNKSIMEFAIEFKDPKLLKVLQNHPNIFYSDRTSLAFELALAKGDDSINDYYKETETIYHEQYIKLLESIKNNDLNGIQSSFKSTDYYDIYELENLVQEISGPDTLELLFSLGLNPFTYKITEVEKNKGFENDIFSIASVTPSLLKIVASNSILLGDSKNPLDKRERTYLELNPKEWFKTSFSNTVIQQNLISSSIIFRDIESLKYIYEQFYEKNNTIDENNLLLQKMLQVALIQPQLNTNILSYIIFKIKALSQEDNYQFLNLVYMISKDAIETLMMSFRKWPRLLDSKNISELIVAALYSNNNTTSFILKTFPIKNLPIHSIKYVISNLLVQSKEFVKYIVEKYALKINITLSSGQWIFNSLMADLLKDEENNKEKIIHLLNQSVEFKLDSDDSLKFKMLRKYNIKTDTQKAFFKSDGIVQRIRYMFDEKKQNELLSMYNKKLPGRNILCTAQVVFPLYESHKKIFHNFYKNELKCTKKIRNTKNIPIAFVQIKKGFSTDIHIDTHKKDSFLNKTKMHYIIDYLSLSKLERVVSSLSCEVNIKYCQEILIRIINKNKYKGLVRDFFRENKSSNLFDSPKLQAMRSRNKYFDKDSDSRKLEYILDNFELNKDNYSHYDFYPYFKVISDSNDFQEIYPIELFDRLIKVLFTKGKNYLIRNTNFININLKEEGQYIIDERFFDILTTSNISLTMLSNIFEINENFNHPWNRVSSCEEHASYMFVKEKKYRKLLYKMVRINKETRFRSLRINLCGHIGHNEILDYLIEEQSGDLEEQIRIISHYAFKFNKYGDFLARISLLTNRTEGGETFLKKMIDAKLYRLAYNMFKEVFANQTSYTSERERKKYNSISSLKMDSKNNTLLHSLMAIDPDTLSESDEEIIFKFAEYLTSSLDNTNLKNDDGLTPYDLMDKNYRYFSDMRDIINE